MKQSKVTRLEMTSCLKDIADCYVTAMKWRAV